MKRYGVVTTENRKFEMHFILASYIADIPEDEDLLGFSRENETFIPFHICDASR